MGLTVFALALCTYFYLNRAESGQAELSDKTAPAMEIQPEAEEEIMIETKNPRTLSAPMLTIGKTKSYEAVLQTTAGEIKIKLFADKTPITVNNFVYLAREGFYDGTVFHRVVDGFMIQGGDPNGDGTGGPGYRFEDEPFTGEYDRGTVAMANAGPDTNGSQFFIVHQNYPLPSDYVIFGQVSEGLEVVDQIASAETKLSPSGEKSTPVSPVTVESVEILEK